FALPGSRFAPPRPLRKRRLRDIFLRSRPPLLCEEGNVTRKDAALSRLLRVRLRSEDFSPSVDRALFHVVGCCDSTCAGLNRSTRSVGGRTSPSSPQSRRRQTRRAFPFGETAAQCRAGRY